MEVVGGVGSGEVGREDGRSVGDVMRGIFLKSLLACRLILWRGVVEGYEDGDHIVFPVCSSGGPGWQEVDRPGPERGGQGGRDGGWRRGLRGSIVSFSFCNSFCIFFCYISSFLSFGLPLGRSLG